ncbi:MAG: hypothetical protein ACI4WT_12435 [Oligosphaeraceae bacterium]
MKSISRLLCLAATLASLAVSAAEFTFDINIGDLKSLTFGFQDTSTIDPESPIPPNFPAAGIKYLYFQGHGDEDDPLSQTSLAQCYAKYFPTDQTAGTWRLVSETNTSIAFSLAAGEIPTGATLQIRKENDATAATTAIADGTSFSVENGVAYLIEYADADATVIPAPPANSHNLAIIAAKGDYTLDLPKAPEGFSTQILTDTLKAFDQNGNSIEAAISITEDARLTLGDIPEELATISFQYVFTDGAVSSDAASAIVTVSKAIAATLVSDKTVLIDPLSIPTGEDFLSFDIEYALKAAKLNEALPFAFTLPAWNTGDDKLLVIAETAITKADDADSSAGTIDLSKGTITVTETDATLRLTIQASKQIKFGGPIYAAINDLPIAAPYLIVKGSQTLDFDGDGEITFDDANYFYNFALKDFSERTRPSALMAFGTENANETDANRALEYFKANFQALDFDGDGEITFDDANYFYNFALKDFSERTRPTALMAFGTEDANETNANTALELFKQLYNNNK